MTPRLVLAGAAAITQVVERSGATAMRVRRTIFDRSSVYHDIPVAFDVRNGAQLVNASLARPTIERDITLASLLGYHPQDFTFCVNRNFGFDAVQHVRAARDATTSIPVVAHPTGRPLESLRTAV